MIPDSGKHPHGDPAQARVARKAGRTKERETSRDPAQSPAHVVGQGTDQWRSPARSDRLC